MRRLILLFMFFSGQVLQPAPQGQSLNLTNLEIRQEFGGWIEIQAQADSNLEFSDVQLLFQDELSPAGRVLPVSVQAGNSLLAVYDLAEQPWLKPFTTITFSFRATLADGQQLNSSPQTYQYTDDRYTWQTLDSDKGITIRWVAGDLNFGQSALNAALRGQARFQEITTLTQSNPATLYIYPSHETLSEALRLNTNLAASGHAAGLANIGWLTIAPGPLQDSQFEQLIPHELAHILLTQSFGIDTDRLPAWLNEGIASAVELYPNPDYTLVIHRARERNALLAMSNLCGPMPQDAASALVSYAQSDSFVRFLHSSYGAIAIRGILDSYALGAACDSGPQPATGYTLTQLEAQWRRSTLAESQAGQLAQGLSPWLWFSLLIFAAPLVSIIKSIRSART